MKNNEIDDTLKQIKLNNYEGLKKLALNYSGYINKLLIDGDIDYNEVISELMMIITNIISQNNKEIENLDGYIRKSLKNNVIKIKRENKKTITCENLNYISDQNTIEEYKENQLEEIDHKNYKKIKLEIEKLSKNEKQVFEAYYVYGKSVEDIMKYYDLGKRTVYGTINRAKEKIRKNIMNSLNGTLDE